MELKSINIIQNEGNGYDDFFLSCEAFIGPENQYYVYKVYGFNVISIKRLYNQFLDVDNGIMLNRGWLIMKFYNEKEINQKINSIIKNCISDNDEHTYQKISQYLRLPYEY